MDTGTAKNKLYIIILYWPMAMHAHMSVKYVYTNNTMPLHVSQTSLIYLYKVYVFL